MLKMYTKDRKWIVIDGEREIEFDTATDALEFVFFMLPLMPKVPQVPRSIYPVTTLNPFPNRKKKKVTFRRCKAV